MPGISIFSVFLRGTALLLAVLIAGCASPQADRGFSPDAAEQNLADLMVRRLELARHVAWVKFQNNLPVADPKREAELLASLVTQGAQMGVPASEAEIFFGAQIRASRKVQEELIVAWRRGATLPAFAPWDLRRHIRPKLDEVSSGMLTALKPPTPPNGRPFANYATSELRQRGFSASVAALATAPLR